MDRVIFVLSIKLAVLLAAFSFVTKILYFHNWTTLVLYPIFTFIIWIILFYFFLIMIKKNVPEIFALFMPGHQDFDGDHYVGLGSGGVSAETEKPHNIRNEGNEPSQLNEIGVEDFKPGDTNNLDSTFEEDVIKMQQKDEHEKVSNKLRDDKSENIGSDYEESGNRENLEDDGIISENMKETAIYYKGKRMLGKDDFKQNPKDLAKAVSNMIMSDENR